MNLTIKNQTAGTRSYLGGIVTVAESAQTTIARELNVVIITDAQFVSDVNTKTVILNNGAVDLNEGAGLELIKAFSAFSTDPLATLPLYYQAPVNIRQSATTATGATVWAMRNPAVSPVSCVIERIMLNAFLDAATPLGAQTMTYDLVRFSTATPTGGTAITPIRASTLASASGVDCRYIDTGLTTTSVVFETPFAQISCPDVRGSVARYIKERSVIKLAAGEGLAIRLSTNAALVGQGISGEIVWSLR